MPPFFSAEYNVEKEGKQLPGRVSHVAVAAYGNLLVVSGGFSGYARGDLMAFKFPSYVAPPQVTLYTCKRLKLPSYLDTCTKCIHI